MLDFLRRKKRPYAPTDESMLRWALIHEREAIRDNDLKLLRTTITKRRKEVMEMLGKEVITEPEYQRHLDTLNIIEKHALDVVFLRNRERMQELGAPKKRRGLSKFHGVDMGMGGAALEQQTDENQKPDNDTNNT